MNTQWTAPLASCDGLNECCDVSFDADSVSHFLFSVQDFNMGTLLRLDASKDYDPDNTIIVPRIQFFAIEIARLREGCNNMHSKKK